VSLAPGVRLGPYEVLSSLGAGGMGVVYRARDARLGRDVAIKALPDLFARDPERLARFEREAKLLASLSHPHIAAIYGLEEVEGHRYLVLEYIEGPTLAERLAKGPLPLSEALEICRDIAAGVEAAHESGVIHRDLKPGNVMLTLSGGVKVLDFGLAKGGTGSSPESNLADSPTLTTPPTGAGVILGTAAYMSPEQARGKAVDRRADIWSFGCVLYECLTGKQTFEGETVSDLIAKILEREPDWSALPAGLPSRVMGLLRRCLTKDAKQRLRDIGDARLELTEVMTGAPEPEAKAAKKRSIRFELAIAVLAALASVIATKAFDRVGSRAPRDPHVHAVLTHDLGGPIAPYPASLAISPDGKRVAYLVADSTGTQLWVRDLDQEAPRLVYSKSSATDVFWSPDSRHLGFSTTGDRARLWKVPAEGGDPVSICDVKWTRGATWGSQGVIVFQPTPEGPLYRVSASGGDAEPVTEIDTSRHQTGHRMPCFLPDGEHFLYAGLPQGPRGWDIFLGSLGSKKARKILTAGSGVTYVEPGHLLYVRDGKLVAHRFDARSLKLSGDPVPIGDPADSGPVDATTFASASRDGRLVMLRNSAPDTRVEWVDRGGQTLGRVPLPSGQYFQISPSPDGRSVLSSRTASNSAAEIWHSDPARGTTTRLTPAGRNDAGPVWLPDGSHYAFASLREGGMRIFVAGVGDAADPRLVPTTNAQFQSPTGVSPDGRTLVVTIVDPVNQFDLWAVPVDGGGKPVPLVRSPAWEDVAVVSPDGKWLAFQSNETGQMEIYVQPFPGPGPRTRVSLDGGHDAVWTRGGKELLFQRDGTGGGSVMAVAVGTGEPFSAGTPRALFHRGGLLGFSAPPAGDRILVLSNAEGAVPPSIALTLDWTRQLKEK